ncbi:MAG: cyclic nucleotide-binding domain-containing protein [Defluviitaleaceae bacterium]|nr:cyclic nucleotide-binding domain-containing protein [Defluviitaleaceae bacterium]
MPLSEFKQGSTIHIKGEALRNLSLITKGSVVTSLNGHKFQFEKGSALGLYDIHSGNHSHTYIAASDVAVFQYPYSNFNALDAMFYENADAAQLITNAMLNQISELLQYRRALKQEADSADELVGEVYSRYEELCKQYALTPKKLPGISKIAPFSGDDPVENWLQNYYLEVKGLDPAIYKGVFYGKPAISSEFIRRGAGDIHLVLQSCAIYQEYLTGMSKFFLNSDDHDLFSLISELHFQSINIKGAYEAVGSFMTMLTTLLPNMTGIDLEKYDERLKTYKDKLSVKHESQEITDAPTGQGLKQNLADSLDIILNYSEWDEETCTKFTKLIKDYTKLSDRGSSDDAVNRLRRSLTEIFYNLYRLVFVKSLNDSNTPTIIKMFLNFGYVDAELAGYENADFLYSIADSLKGDPESGIYTISEWLTAVFCGKKEPSKNEFDMDYPAHVRELRTTGKITEKEEANLLADPDKKLEFEMENMFPSVNKITCGRITTFCPLFSDNNAQRNIESSLVTPDQIKEIINEIRSIDFSAFYRGTIFSSEEIGVSREIVNVEILPNIILMPNIGARGVMWQEIEGRNRASKARIFMPIILQSDLKTLTIRLTGEFRWEMCKRIQGARWNDLSDPSLTSEFCDYLQFYKGNRELSSEVKESIKLELSRANNNYRNVFISNYSDWLTYESNGSPRLNKNVRRMMITYCPFTAAIREKLMMNSQYTDLLNKYNFKQQQREQQLSRLIQKVGKTTKNIPQELLGEFEFAKM